MGLPGARPHHVLEGARRQISPATPFSSRFSRPLSARYVGRSARVRWAYSGAEPAVYVRVHRRPKGNLICRAGNYFRIFSPGPAILPGLII